jgi:glutathione peroxidase
VARDEPHPDTLTAAPLAPRARALFTPRMHLPLRRALPVLALALALAPVLAAADEPTAASAAEESPLHSMHVQALDGSDLDLGKYRGRVLLLVNTASKCGFTPQYEGLEALHEKFAGRGLSVVGVPSNDFGRQEPGTSEEIAAFCKKNYGVTFELTSKMPVTGEEKAPLYAWLTSQSAPGVQPGEVQWNFEKFLVSRDGRVVGRFGSRIKPDDPALLAAIEAELAKPATP